MKEKICFNDLARKCKISKYFKIRLYFVTNTSFTDNPHWTKCRLLYYLLFTLTTLPTTTSQKSTA